MEKPETFNVQPATGLAVRIANWLLIGQCGISASYLAGVALNGGGYKSPWQYTTPRDPIELGRCVTLLQTAPEVRALAFPVIAEMHPAWRVYLEQWDQLAALWRVGDFNATAARLRELREGAGAVEGSRLKVAGSAGSKANEEENLQPATCTLQRSSSPNSQPSELTAQLL